MNRRLRHPLLAPTPGPLVTLGPLVALGLLAACAPPAERPAAWSTPTATSDACAAIAGT